VTSRAWTLTRALYGRANGRRRRIANRLKYRGLVLLMFGLIYVAVGLSVIHANDYAPDLIHTHLPTWFRVALWALPGVVAVAVCADHKWQAIAFGLLFLGPCERAVSFLVAVNPFDGANYDRLPGALVYVLISLMVVLMASWPDPVAIEERVAEQVDGTLLRDDGKLFLDGGGHVAELHDDEQDRTDDLGRMTGSGEGK